MSMNPADGSKTLRVRDTTASEFRDLITWPMEEEGGAVAFALDGKSVSVKVIVQYLCLSGLHGVFGTYINWGSLCKHRKAWTLISYKVVEMHIQSLD
jgi:hypothetical protein